MVLAWLSVGRAISHRPVSVIFVIFILAILFRILVRPYRALSDPSSEVLEDADLVWEFTSQQGYAPLGNHTLTPDGLLIVNPDAPHPIFQLIRDAEVAWDAKCARASKTLGDAVAEYRRRYRRAPPRGFDKWWDYVVKHNVQLPDEYDEIFDDIEPFMGIDPHELARTQQELEGTPDVVTVEKTDAHPRLEIISSTLTAERQYLKGIVNGIFALIRDVEHDLPPLRITISPFDNPSMFSDWRIKRMALDAAANGTTLSSADLPAVTEHGWTKACPPDSPARLHPPQTPPDSITPHLPPLSPKTFIASHRDAMDPCMHPSLLITHGQFLSYKEGPRPKHTLVPRFSLCATLLHHDIRPPVSYGWNFESEAGSNGEEDVPWEHKVNDRLGWRGRTTGMYASPDSWWAHSQRMRLVKLTNALEGNVSVLGVPPKGDRAETIPVGNPEDVPLAIVNPAWMDVAFAVVPISCDEAHGTCDEIARTLKFREKQESEEEGQYKFILDVDGNGWSGRFKRLMTSNALVFKATVYPEWYTSRIAPWVHYIPIQVSYADLYDAVSFFRVHDELGRRIAQAGKKWSQQFWRREDLTAYLYRLLLEYARAVSLDREKMDYAQ